MAYRIGGLEGINKAIECNRVATCQYSSGLQVTGVFTEVLTDANGQPDLPPHNRADCLALRTKNWKDKARNITPKDLARRLANGNRSICEKATRQNWNFTVE